MPGRRLWRPLGCVQQPPQALAGARLRGLFPAGGFALVAGLSSLRRELGPHVRRVSADHRQSMQPEVAPAFGEDQPGDVIEGRPAGLPAPVDQAADQLPQHRATAGAAAGPARPPGQLRHLAHLQLADPFPGHAILSTQRGQGEALLAVQPEPAPQHRPPLIACTGGRLDQVSDLGPQGQRRGLGVDSPLAAHRAQPGQARLVDLLPSVGQQQLPANTEHAPCCGGQLRLVYLSQV